MNISLIDDRSRMSFLPKHFGRDMMRVEARVYHYADKALDGYRGGLWAFAEADNGAGFMIPPPGPHRTITDGYDWLETEFCCNSGELGREAAGLAITTIAVNHELNARPDSSNCERLVGEWEKLMEAVHEHPEASELLTILD
jgi:hypothetical protein